MDLTMLTATDLRDRITRREISALEAVGAALARIEALDPLLRAFVCVDEAGARARARALDASGGIAGPLHGLPLAVKDVTDVAGLPTTFGTALLEARPARTSHPVIARLMAAGAIPIGKTTVPDFGFGSVCTSSLRGAVRNPHDPRLAAEGSSGGSAAAVSAGMVPLATGGDFGGSLRSPASFCGVVSIRPTPGRVPDPDRRLAWSNLVTDGPIARTLPDAALLLDAMRGTDPRDPLSGLAPRDPLAFPPRIAATEDFGTAPVSGEVRGLFRGAVRAAEALLGPIETAAPDCRDAVACFLTLRAALLRDAHGGLLDRFGDRLPHGVAWNLRQGGGVTAAEYLAAEAARGALYRRFLAFFERHDYLLAPAVALMPFPAGIEDILEIDGVPLPTLVHYYAITFVTSLAGCPVVTLPAAWSAAGLPLGLQIIGPPGSDDHLISFALGLETGLGWRHRPPDPAGLSGAAGKAAGKAEAVP